MRRILTYVLPDRFFYGDDRLTVSATRLLERLGIGAIGILVGAGTLLASDALREVIAGGFLASGLSIVVWAFSSYRREIRQIEQELRRSAEVDLLHARLNHLAARLGAPLIAINYQLEHAIGARMQRLSHVSGLEEFWGKAHTTEDGYEFWDNVGLGEMP